jgi:hypothetical protein
MPELFRSARCGCAVAGSVGGQEGSDATLHAKDHVPSFLSEAGCNNSSPPSPVELSCYAARVSGG